MSEEYSDIKWYFIFMMILVVCMCINFSLQSFFENKYKAPEPPKTVEMTVEPPQDIVLEQE